MNKKPNIIEVSGKRVFWRIGYAPTDDFANNLLTLIAWYFMGQERDKQKCQLACKIPTDSPVNIKYLVRVQINRLVKDIETELN